MSRSRAAIDRMTLGPTVHKRHLALALFPILAIAGTPTRAGSVVVDDLDLDEGNVVALLEQTSQYYIDAMHRLVNDRYRDEYRAIRWEDLETSMTQARVARLEYRFTVGGEPRVRVYHAMGGEPLGALGEAIFEGPTRPGTPVSPEPAVEPWDPDIDEAVPSTPSRTLPAIDANDEVFFGGFDEVDVRARILPAEDSALQAFHIDGEDRALDPEMKALRQIEDDIRHNVVPAGGRIDAKIGGVLCSSCRYAMQGMADTYGVDIRATQIFQTLPQSRQETLVRSGRARLSRGRLVHPSSGRPLLAHDALLGAREAQVRRSLSSRALGRSFKGMQWSARSFLPGSPGESPTMELPAGTRRMDNPDAGPLTPECEARLR